MANQKHFYVLFIAAIWGRMIESACAEAEPPRRRAAERRSIIGAYLKCITNLIKIFFFIALPPRFFCAEVFDGGMSIDRNR